ncbi:hypothetical protein EDB92DRAFT_849689 [Lactarius akahatsu]|uniref:Uncharacterized protein n=1 Tax=Lactarius akahatsu TaxID=416441 RepID=A0AAD4LJG6_9AGAM|nr:hypothetical protein EDB92DRAFT_849689 [Lactarius akahatsu]
MQEHDLAVRPVLRENLHVPDALHLAHAHHWQLPPRRRSPPPRPVAPSPLSSQALSLAAPASAFPRTHRICACHTGMSRSTSACRISSGAFRLCNKTRRQYVSMRYCVPVASNETGRTPRDRHPHKGHAGETYGCDRLTVGNCNASFPEGTNPHSLLGAMRGSLRKGDEKNTSTTFASEFNRWITLDEIFFGAHNQTCQFSFCSCDRDLR